jgi:hypothetical protein
MGSMTPATRSVSWWRQQPEGAPTSSGRVAWGFDRPYARNRFILQPAWVARFSPFTSRVGFNQPETPKVGTSWAKPKNPVFLARNCPIKLLGENSGDIADLATVRQRNALSP